MRTFCRALLAAGLLFTGSDVLAKTRHATHARLAAPLGTPACVFDRERDAFDIEGLKSQMMVTATTCRGDAQAHYNGFMSRYLPVVAGAENTLHNYFNRSYGKAGSKQYDEYMTQLADNQEQAGLKAGTAYCDNLNVMFDEVASLHNPSELHDYSNSKMLYQPVSLSTCSGTPPPEPVSRKAKHVSHAAKHT